MPPISTINLPSGHEPLRHWERNYLIAMLIIVTAFCVLTVHRSAYQDIRRTDASVYFRAGWAIRTGANPYEVPDDRNLHFAYPPVVAVLMSPFAYAPPGAEGDWMLPFEAAISIWILLCVLATFLAVHWFATGLEETARDPALQSPPAGSRRWWYNRMVPIYVCIVPIGGTVSRGQVTPFLLLFIAGMFLATVRGKRFASGLWLAAAICTKIIPGLLLIFPLVRRDLRALAGVAIGGFIGVAVLPTAELGINGAIQVHEQFISHMIKPALGMGGTSTMQTEMMSMNRPGCQSIKAIIHNYQHWDRDLRPDTASTFTNRTHLAISFLLLAGLILAYGWRRDHDAVGMLTMLGALLTLMCIISPESHTHYFCMTMPLVMALAWRSIEARPQRLIPTMRTLALLVFSGFCLMIVSVPIVEWRREVGIPMYASILLWLAAIYQLRTEPTAGIAATDLKQPLSRAA